MKTAFVQTVVPKSNEIRSKIAHRLSQAFMFAALNTEELDVVIDAMKEVKFNPTESVIEEGAKGDVLYVVEEG